MDGQFEKLAYEAALRSLDKQEAYVEELRARAGVLLAASSLVSSFLGKQAFPSHGPHALAIVALLAFAVSLATNVFVLLPKQGLVFAQKGADLYESLFPTGSDMPEVYRRMTFVLAAVALVTEVMALAVLLWDNLLSA